MKAVFKQNNFDLIRIVAATQVLLLHSINHLHIEHSSWHGLIHLFPGVPVFFTISGFLISASYERNSSIRSYIMNRFLRIYPGLWGCLILTVIVAYFLGFSFFHKSALLWFASQIVGLIYTPAFLDDFGFGSYNGSLWTICIELQFYVVLPLVYLLMRSNNYVLFILFIFFVIIKLLFLVFFPSMATDHETSVEKLLRYSFLPHFYIFLAGVIMQRLKFYEAKWIYNKAVYWITAYIIVAQFLSPVSVVSLLLLSVSVISLAYTDIKLGYKLLSGNDISYGVYIYHGLVLSLMVSMNLTNNSYYMLLVLGCSYLLGYCSWIFVEKPWLSLKKRINRKQFTSFLMGKSSISERVEV